MEQFTDGNLLTEFCNGNREAIRQVCKSSAQRIEQYGLLNDENVVGLLRQILERIGEGQSPNKAFGWKQKTVGNMAKNLAFRDWEVRTVVRDLLRENHNLTWACGMVSYEQRGEKLLGFRLGLSTIKTICKGLTADTELPLPENIYPITLL